MSNRSLIRRTVYAILIASVASLKMVPLDGYPSVYYFVDINGTEDEEVYRKNYYVFVYPRREPPSKALRRCEEGMGGAIAEFGREAYSALYKVYLIEGPLFARRYNRKDPEIAIYLRDKDGQVSLVCIGAKPPLIRHQPFLAFGDIVTCATTKETFMKLHPVTWEPTSTATTTTTTTTTPTTTTTTATITTPTTTTTTATITTIGTTTNITTTSSVGTNSTSAHTFAVGTTSTVTVSATSDTTSTEDFTQPTSYPSSSDSPGMNEPCKLKTIALLMILFM
uniref:Pre-mRNA-processing factor 17 n=1 Tax=Parascaris univalens TaxID=6257 RepID=A0A915BZM8_PARUN